MDGVNDRIAEYETSLRDAERAIEGAGKAICSLRGDLPRHELNMVLEKVQNLIRGTWQLYDNPDIEEA